ncbi:MAG: polyphosphate kinase 2 family protein [Planctomycetes bacterium]|nr:polyphosphate kinase 2 family protein [Planctomycetota bacterium]
MFTAPPSPFLVPFDGRFEVGSQPTAPGADAPGKDDRKKRLEQCVERIAALQHVMYAHDKHAMLLVFQAMDAAGKDGTIRALLTGVNPAGCQVFAFKQPSSLELDHDFLWRTGMCLPERGRIGVFNRSYYEEVLVVRVHPEFLDAQNLPERPDLETLWAHRMESIRDHELHLARNGVVVLKFWLNVSRDEQRKRFLSRLEEPEKNWKFSQGDLRERGFWDAYMRAYEQALAETSRPWAPWYAIPADSKSFLRMTVAELVCAAFESLDLKYPTVRAEDVARFAEIRRKLETEK